MVIKLHQSLIFATKVTFSDPWPHLLHSRSTPPRALLLPLSSCLGPARSPPTPRCTWSWHIPCLLGAQGQPAAHILPVHPKGIIEVVRRLQIHVGVTSSSGGRCSTFRVILTNLPLSSSNRVIPLFPPSILHLCRKFATSSYR